MDAIELLLTRQSSPRLVEPCPSEAQLQVIFDAAVRVPDHGALTPWEFIVAQGEGLSRLGNLFVEAVKQTDADEEKQRKVQGMPLRAPMVIVVVAKPKPHAKVPPLEQLLATGCATMAMQQAAFAQGLGAIWRTGDLAFNKHLNRGLGLDSKDQVIGFLYVGTPAVKAAIKAPKNGSEFVRYL